MTRRNVTRLRENPAAAPTPDRVIDARFKVVGKRSIIGRVLRFVLALAGAALIGALVPLVWILAEDLFAALTQR